MVRTKDAKVVMAKSSRKVASASISAGDDKSSAKGKYSGGNPYCPRETPVWQKPITLFFKHSVYEKNSAGPSEKCLGTEKGETNICDIVSLSSDDNDKNICDIVSVSSDDDDITIVEVDDIYDEKTIFEVDDDDSDATVFEELSK